MQANPVTGICFADKVDVDADVARTHPKDFEPGHDGTQIPLERPEPRPVLGITELLEKLEAMDIAPPAKAMIEAEEA